MADVQAVWGTITYTNIYYSDSSLKSKGKYSKNYWPKIPQISWKSVCPSDINAKIHTMQQQKKFKSQDKDRWVVTEVWTGTREETGVTGRGVEFHLRSWKCKTDGGDDCVAEHVLKYCPVCLYMDKLCAHKLYFSETVRFSLVIGTVVAITIKGRFLT